MVAFSLMDERQAVLEPFGHDLVNVPGAVVDLPDHVFRGVPELNGLSPGMAGEDAGHYATVMIYLRLVELPRIAYHFLDRAD